MEKEALKTAIRRSISEVLETMFFLPLEFPEGQGEAMPGREGNGKVLVTKLSFRGPLSGEFFFYIPEALTLSLTASFLGEEESKVTPAHVTDMAKEIVNMIAGNAFSILDDKGLYDLGIPEVIECHGMRTEGPGLTVPIRTIDSSLAIRLELSA